MRPGDDRSAARHRFDHYQAERLRPPDRKQQRAGVSQKRILGRAPHLADKFHPAMRFAQQRLDCLLAVAPFPRQIFAATLSFMPAFWAMAIARSTGRGKYGLETPSSFQGRA